MPLLRRAPFVPQSPPDRLRINDEVFYCKLTGEVFTDYEKFFERIILCNSLVWTCAFTGHPNLTFQEALHSERRAQEQLNDFPNCLQVPLVYLAYLTHRSRLNDAVDDVYLFTKDRYFVGESVFVADSNERTMCKIVKVIPPTGKFPLANGNAVNSASNSDIICLDDGDDDDALQPPSKKMKLSESGGKKDGENKTMSLGPDPLLYHYVVQDLKDGRTFTTDAKSISRKKGVLNREKCKLFVKEHCNVEEDGIWRVKAKYADKYQVAKLDFISFFAGPLPSFKVSEARKRRPSARVSSDVELPAAAGVIDLTEDDEAMLADGKDGKAKEKKTKKTKREGKSVEKLKQAEEMQKKKEAEMLNIDEEFRRMRQEMAERAKKREQERLEKQKAKELRKKELRKKADEQRQKRKEESEKKKLERKQQDALLHAINKPREDLECDDLKDLPSPTPVSCAIPIESFGDAILVLEYLSCFQSVFEFNLPKNISVDNFAKALNDTDLDGLFADIVRELLNAIFRLQEEENHEGPSDEKDWKGLLDGLEEFEDKSVDLIRAATLASQMTVANYGSQLRKLQLDSYTLTEIVRLHLLTSGSLSGINSKYDYQQRGGYSPRDDPGLVFLQQEASILHTLGERNVFDLTCSEKLKIITVLIHQLLTFVVSRDVIDENCEKLKQVQKNLRQLQLAEQRRCKDETHHRWKKRMEERQRQLPESKIQGGTETDKNLAEGNLEEGRQSTPKKRVTEGQSNKDYENMPTENIDWDKITPEERAQMKEFYEKKEKELVDLAAELQRSRSISPLGCDRLFRRVWVFSSIAGLFVEDQESCVPSENSQPAMQTVVRHSACCKAKIGNDDVSSEGGKSDKENVPFLLNDESNLSKGVLEKHRVQTATVYELVAARNRVRWAFYSSPEQLDLLIESLNPRGVRESHLRSALLEQRDRLKDWIGKCNSQALCNAWEEISETVQEQRSRSRNKQTQIVQKYASAQECLEKNLCDMLLDIEERIDAGSLGSLKVNRRAEWRLALEEMQSVPQVVKQDHANGFAEDGQLQKRDKVIESVPSVKVLAKALLQIEQMVDERYFEAPFGNETSKKARQKAPASRDGSRSTRDRKDQDVRKDAASVDSDDDDSSSGAVREHWKESLMSSTSLPQIFLHLAVLESSITWSRSALHARCRICRRKGDGERMLLCDGCDRGHHMYCLKPPVKHVPAGDWFCPSCRPKDVLHTPRKKLESFDEVLSDEESEPTESLPAEEQSENDLMSSSEDDEDDVEDKEHTDDDEEEEGGGDDEEESEEDSDFKTAIKPTSAKIKFVKGESQFRRSVPNESAEPAVSHMKTRLRSVAATNVNTNGRDSSQERAPVTFESKRGAEAINGRSKFSFFQTNDGLLRSIQRSTKTPRVKTSSCPKNSKVGLETEATDSDGSAATGRPKRSRINLESERTTNQRVSRKNVADDSKHKGDEMSSFVTKSRDKEQLSLMKTCEDLLSELTQRDEAWPFLKPVSRREAPDYFDIVKKPMDFSRIRNKVNRFEYLQPAELLQDIRLIFINYKEYNMPTAPEFAAGQKLESYFEKRLRELKLGSLMSSPGKSRGSRSDVSSKTLRKRTL